MAEKVPRLVATVDVHKFKLDAMDGFLLTRIDGRLTKKQLAQDTGLPEFQIDKTVEKLEKLGVVEFIDPSAPAVNALPAPTRGRMQLPEFTSIEGSAPKYDPKELDEEIDLSADQKKRILDMFYRLDDLDHYTLLGVGKDADKKTVKRSYFELASLMHPDRYFKKKLGSFKSKKKSRCRHGLLVVSTAATWIRPGVVPAVMTPLEREAPREGPRNSQLIGPE